MKDEIKVTDQDITDRLQVLSGLTPVDEIEMFDLYSRLPFELAQPYLPHSAQKDTFEVDFSQLRPPLLTCREYLEFAWHKANDARAMSAARSLSHIRAWLFLAGFASLLCHFKEAHWYGKKQLVIASMLCGFDWQSHDDGVWRDMQNPLSSIGGMTTAVQIQEAYTITNEATHSRRNS